MVTQSPSRTKSLRKIEMARELEPFFDLDKRIPTNHFRDWRADRDMRLTYFITWVCVAILGLAPFLLVYWVGNP